MVLSPHFRRIFFGDGGDSRVGCRSSSSITITSRLAGMVEAVVDGQTYWAHPRVESFPSRDAASLPSIKTVALKGPYGFCFNSATTRLCNDVSSDAGFIVHDWFAPYLGEL